MAFPGMLRRVAHIRTDISEECSASIIWVARIGGLGILAVTSNRSTLRRNTIIILMMEAILSSETSVLTKATRRNTPQDNVREMFYLLGIAVEVVERSYQHGMRTNTPLARESNLML
jgi:hypothetical protein